MSSKHNSLLNAASEAIPATPKAFPYVFGFLFSSITIIGSFWAVQHHVLSPQGLYVTVGLLAFAQFFVHTLCFLRNNLSQKNASWNTISLLFTLIIISIVIVGSLWIMYNLNQNMLP